MCFRYLHLLGLNKAFSTGILYGQLSLVWARLAGLIFAGIGSCGVKLQKTVAGAPREEAELADGIKVLPRDVWIHGWK